LSSSSQETSLLDLLNLNILRVGERLELKYLGVIHYAILGSDGTLRGMDDGLVFKTPSNWSLHVKRRFNPNLQSDNGWVSVTTSNGVTLANARKQATHHQQQHGLLLIHNNNNNSTSNSSIPITTASFLPSTLSSSEVAIKQSMVRTSSNGGIGSSSNNNNSSSGNIVPGDVKKIIHTSTSSTMGEDNNKDGGEQQQLLQLQQLEEDNSKRLKRLVTLESLIQSGVLVPGPRRLVIRYKGVTFWGELLTNGSIRDEITNQIFTILSRWSLACKLRLNSSLQSDDGWLSTLVNTGDSKFVTLDSLRKIHENIIVASNNSTIGGNNKTTLQQQQPQPQLMEIISPPHPSQSASSSSNSGNIEQNNNCLLCSNHEVVDEQHQHQQPQIHTNNKKLHCLKCKRYAHANCCLSKSKSSSGAATSYLASQDIMLLQTFQYCSEDCRVESMFHVREGDFIYLRVEFPFGKPIGWFRACVKKIDPFNHPFASHGISMDQIVTTTQSSLQFEQQQHRQQQHQQQQQRLLAAVVAFKVSGGGAGSGLDHLYWVSLFCPSIVALQDHDYECCEIFKRQDARWRREFLLNHQGIQQSGGGGT
jgi:hypothetical protein